MWWEIQARELHCKRVIDAAWPFADRDAHDRYREYARRRGLTGRLTWEDMYNWCVQDEEWLECIMLSRLSGGVL